MPVMSFIWILLAFVVWGVVHSLLATFESKGLAGRLLGENFRRRWYRLLYNLFSVASFLPVLALTALLPDQPIYAIPFPWVILTFLIQIAAGIMVLAAVSLTGTLSFLGLQQITQPENEDQPRAFVSDGLYRIVRHPIYTFSLVFLWLVPRMSWNLLAFNLAATAYFVIGALFEERKLVREFGPEYLEYRTRVPFLIPRRPRS